MNDGPKPGTIVALVVVVLVLILGGVTACATIERVDPGNAGILVDFGRGTATGQPSVSPRATGQYVFIWPITQALKEYPISQQSLTMVMAVNEGQVIGDDSVQCRDTNGILMNVDSTLLWRVDPSRVDDLYLLRPNDDINAITANVVRRDARFAITMACSEFTYDAIYGDMREEFNTRIEEIARESLDDSFIVVDRFLLGEIHLQQAQADAVSAKAVAEQQAQQAAFLAEQRRNEAAAAIAVAEGEKQVSILQAEAQAESIRIIQEQLAQSPLYLQYLIAQNWNGEMPTTLVITDSNGNPLLTIPVTGVTTPEESPTPTAP